MINLPTLRTLILTLFVFSVVTTGILPQAVFAQSGLRDSFDEVNTIRDKAEVRDIGNLPEFIVAFLRIALFLVVTIAVAMVIWGGFLYITSAGEEDRASKGKRTILYALLGLVLIGLSAVIVNFVVVAFT